MWPFRKKPDRMPDSMFEFFWGMSREAVSDKLKRQRAKDGKMKLEAGKYYETDKGIFQSEACYINDFRIGGYVYTDCGTGYLFGAPRVIREVPPPIRLEVGALYALSDGSVEWCTFHPGYSVHWPYQLGKYWYDLKGEARFPGTPRILHRIKLNEPVSAGNRGEPTKSVSQMIDEGILAPYILYDHGDASDVLTYALWGKDFFQEAKIMYKERAKNEPSNTAKWLMKEQALNAAVAAGTIRVEGDRLVADLGPTLRYSDTIRDRLLGEAEEKYAARIFPNVYYRNLHSNTERCKREPVIPEGYEMFVPWCAPEDSWMMRKTDGVKEWWAPFDSVAFEGYACSGYNVVIRPIANPFNASGPGWFKTRTGSWIKKNGEWSNSMTVGWFLDGKHAGDDERLDLIARATPQQAAILDAL